MVINKSMLRTDMPPVKMLPDGGLNVVLAVCTDKCYCKDNRYMPKWQVVNTLWYEKNHADYEGWIELEDLNVPDEKDCPECHCIEEIHKLLGAVDA